MQAAPVFAKSTGHKLPSAEMCQENRLSGAEVNHNIIMLTNMSFSKPVVIGFEEHYHGVYKVSAA